MIFLPLITFRRELYELENRIKYFLVQRMASLWFLLALTVFSLKLFLVQIVILLSILIKLGVFPFHGWFFRIMRTTSWKFLFLFSTLQKFIPLIVLRNTFLSLPLVLSVLGLTLIFIMRIGTTFLSARLVLTLSSLNNVRWILLSLQRRCIFWLVYIRIYIILLIPVIRFLSMLSLPFSGLFFSSTTRGREKVLFSACIFSLGGLPPFLGFFNKFIIVKLRLSQVSLAFIMLIIFSSLFLLYYYLSLVFSSLRLYPTNIVSGKPGIIFNLRVFLALSFLIIFFLIFLRY